jgi:Ca2+-binding EF-hand superfamily protein
MQSPAHRHRRAIINSRGLDDSSLTFASFFNIPNSTDKSKIYSYNATQNNEDLEAISKKLEMTKCVSYLSPDTISWMNKRRPRCINDKSHFSHISPTRALQLLAIFKGLDYDKSGRISKKELMDALHYVTVNSVTVKPVPMNIDTSNNNRRSSVVGFGRGASVCSNRRESISKIISSVLNENYTHNNIIPTRNESLPVMSKETLYDVFDWMDVDGDGMVDFNEFVLHFTKTSNNEDNDKLQQAFYEFATRHQRQVIIDSLSGSNTHSHINLNSINTRENTLSDMDKYYQMKKLFQLEFIQGSSSEGRIDSCEGGAPLNVLAGPIHKQRVKEQRRARLVNATVK